SQLESPKMVATLLFGRTAPVELVGLDEACTTDREVWVPEGHEGRAGRLDCVFKFGEKAIIVIEVKVIGADESDTVKQRGYFKWLESQTSKYRYPVLLTTSASENSDYEGFRVVLWEDFCRNGRVLLSSLSRQRQSVTASLFAALLGAIEINLLGLPSLSWLTDASDEIILFNALRLGRRIDKVVQYLESTVVAQNG
ncbi:MAG TPA: hypothetical protein VNF99_06265, partial [Stellaceae bacterium]|nr:hypothetical protein [Stellaceae bacterium]